MSSTPPPPMTYGWETLDQRIQPIPLKPIPIRVLQWNTLADGLDVTGEFQIKNRDKILPWKVRAPQIVKRIQAWSPDILCMQEVNHPELMQDPAFEGEYTGEWMEKGDSPCISLEYPPDGCAIFWRDRLFECVATHRIAYKNPETGKPWNQVALIVVLQGRRPELRENYWVVATTHLKAKDGATNVAKRAAQSTQLMAAVDKIAFELIVSEMIVSEFVISVLDGPVSTIVCGDFNSPPEESCAREWEAAGYRSVYPIGGERCWTTWKVRDSGEVHRQIDYMFVRGPIKVLSRLLAPVGAEATPLPTKDLPSDHLPLCAELEWDLRAEGQKRE